MVEKLPISPSQRENAQNKTSISMLDEPQCCTRKWYFTRQEIDDHSPSRKDGIDLKKESRLRKLYCSFLQELGMTIKVPQVTIANAIMLCHQFYMRHSHAKNDWQTIATVSMFLGCKIEDTPRLRKDVVTAAYEILHKKDPSAPGRIRQKDLFNKQQELLLLGERFLLATIAFDLDIQLPYKPLVTALKRLKLGTDIPQVAWNFVNDWLCTTLCLQYKPHYIAAGSVFLAAKYQQVKLPTKNGKVWWLEFDISPKLLEEVIKQMLRLLEQGKGQTSIPMRGRSDQPTAAVAKPILSSPNSFVNTPIDGHHCNDKAQLKNGDTVNIATSEEALPSQTSESGNADSVIEDGDGENPPAVCDSNQNSRCEIVLVENRTRDCDQNPSCKIVSVENGAEDLSKNSTSSTVVENRPEAEDHSIGASHKNSNSKPMIDAARIREALRKRKSEKATNRKAFEVKSDDVDIETWIERRLESENRTRDCDQNPSCKIVSVENGAEDLSKNSTSSTVVENRPEAEGHSVGASHKNSNSKPMIDAARIREALRKRKSEKATNRKAFEVKNDDVDIETWIERRLESEIELESATSDKRQRIGL